MFTKNYAIEFCDTTDNSVEDGTNARSQIQRRTNTRTRRRRWLLLLCQHILRCISSLYQSNNQKLWFHLYMRESFSVHVESIHTPAIFALFSRLIVLSCLSAIEITVTLSARTVKIIRMNKLAIEYYVTSMRIMVVISVNFRQVFFGRSFVFSRSC